jgi:hypothetical protein
MLMIFGDSTLVHIDTEARLTQYEDANGQNRSKLDLIQSKPFTVPRRSIVTLLTVS